MTCVDPIAAAQNWFLVGNSISQKAYRVQSPMDDLSANPGMGECLVEASPPDVVKTVSHQKCPVTKRQFRNDFADGCIRSGVGPGGSNHVFQSYSHIERLRCW